MEILSVNLSTQQLSGLGITYIATLSGTAVTDLVDLPAVDPITHMGSNASVLQAANSCISISVPYGGGSKTILYGQPFPVPKPPGFSLKASWSESGTAVVVIMTDELGGF